MAPKTKRQKREEELLRQEAEREWRGLVGRIRGKLRHQPVSDQKAIRACMLERYGVQL